MGAAGAAQAYARVAGNVAQGVASGVASGVEGFGDALGKALGRVVDAGHQADDQAMRAIKGEGNLTQVATAVSQAELALQTAVTVRDKVVQAYQEIMRMPI